MKEKTKLPPGPSALGRKKSGLERLPTTLINKLVGQNESAAQKIQAKLDKKLKAKPKKKGFYGEAVHKKTVAQRDQVQELVAGPYDFLLEVPPNVDKKQFALDQFNKISRKNFNIRVNCYVFNMIVGGLLLFFSLTFNLTYVVTMWKYNLGWMFVLYYSMCILDIVGSFCGILSLVPDYTFGGWRLCNWFVNRWNKHQGKDTYPKEQKITMIVESKPSGESQASKNKTTLSDSKKAQADAHHSKDMRKKHLPKAKSAPAMKTEGGGAKDSTAHQLYLAQKQLKGGMSKAEMMAMLNKPAEPTTTTHAANKVTKGAQVHPKKKEASEINKTQGMKDNLKDKAKAGAAGGKTILLKGDKVENTPEGEVGHPGWFFKGRFRPCTLCTSGIKINTRKMNQSMACTSCIILNATTVMNIFFTAFYKYKKNLDSKFSAEDDRCNEAEDKHLEKKEICKTFELMFSFLMLCVWIPILSRNLSLCVIGWHTDPSNLYTLRKIIPKSKEEKVNMNKKPGGGTGSRKLKTENAKFTKTIKKGAKPAGRVEKDPWVSSSSSNSEDEVPPVEVEDDVILWHELFQRYAFLMGSEFNDDEDDGWSGDSPPPKEIVNDPRVSGQSEEYDVNEALKQFYREHQKPMEKPVVVRLGESIHHDSKFHFITEDKDK